MGVIRKVSGKSVSSLAGKPTAAKPVRSARVGSLWSVSDAAAGNISLGSVYRSARGTQDAWKSVRGDASRSSGKRYFELQCVVAGTTYGHMIGLASSSFSPGNYPGTSNHSFGISSTQYRSAQFAAGAGTPVFSGVAPTLGSVYQLAVDFTAGKAWAGKDNSWIGSGNPGSGANPTVTFTPASVGALFPVLGIYGYMVSGSSTSGAWQLNTAAGEFVFSLPSGFIAWD